MISYIVSAHERPEALRSCLSTLQNQRGEKQIIVTCNAADRQAELDHAMVAQRFNAAVIWTGQMGCKNCYDAAAIAADLSTGDWLCFPSDDSLYVAEFGRIMIEAAVRDQADLVYCDCVYSQHPYAGDWRYRILESEPRMGRIDKTNFIIRRELFRGFPPHPRNWRDGALIEQVIRDGARAAKAPGILVLHQ